MSEHAPGQGSRDALADAETLRLVAFELRREHNIGAMAAFDVVSLASVATAHLMAGHCHMARQSYIAAARAAFRLCPELRG